VAVRQAFTKLSRGSIVLHHIAALPPDIISSLILSFIGIVRIFCDEAAMLNLVADQM
jgi:hypothetical protein